MITLDWRYSQVTDDVVRDLCALCPEPVGVDVQPGESLLPLLDAINAALAQRGSAYRFFSLDVDSDFYVIACRPADAGARITASGWLKLG